MGKGRITIFLVLALLLIILVLLVGCQSSGRCQETIYTGEVTTLYSKGQYSDTSPTFVVRVRADGENLYPIAHAPSEAYFAGLKVGDTVTISLSCKLKRWYPVQTESR